MKRFAVLVISLALATVVAAVYAQRAAAPAPAGSVTAKAVVAATTFLSGLSTTERARAAFPFNSPQKSNWSNLPSGIYQRNSLRLGDLAPAKRDAALALVASVLSRE